MEFRCWDLDEAGVTLIAPDSRLFLPLFSDIRQHVESRPYGSPPPLPHADGYDPSMNEPDPAGAILWNRSGKFICAWTTIWKYLDVTGCTSGSSFMLGVGARPSLLLPFGIARERRPFLEYWHTIMPGSRRYLVGGAVVGTNADIRPPEPPEYWKGGVFGFRNGPPGHRNEAIQAAALTLDAVFFSNGECAGPDTKQLFEHVVCDAEVHRQVGATARERFASGADAMGILDAVEEITGPATRVPPPPPPPSGNADPESFRQRARWQIARWISTTRSQRGDREVASALVNWADAIIPRYRRI